MLLCLELLQRSGVMIILIKREIIEITLLYSNFLFCLTLRATILR